MSLLSQITQPRLKSTETRITNRKGEVFIEKRLASGETVQEFVGQTNNPEYFNKSTPTELMGGKYEKEQWTTNWEIPAPSEKNQLSFVTYNVWFSEQQWEIRAKALIGLLKRKNADVVCLQEVVPNFAKFLMENQFIRENYIVSDPSGWKTITPYGLLILAKINLGVKKFTSVMLPSNMGRRYLTCEIQLGENRKCKVATSHLESLANAEFRSEQLKNFIYPDLQQSNTDFQIFMGDSNFCTFTSEFSDNVLAPDYMKDVWKGFYPEASLSESRTMVEEALCIDRVLVSKNIQPVAIERIGMEAICYDDAHENYGLPDFQPSVVPSDHCGLYSVVNFF